MNDTQINILSKANGIADDIYIREKPPKLGKSSCRKFHSYKLNCL